MTRELIEIIANLALFLEFSDESVLALEEAVKQQEDISARLQQLSPSQRQEFIETLREIAATLPYREQREYLERFPQEVGIA